MEFQEILVYTLAAGAALAVGWMFVSRGDGVSDHQYESGWSDMPMVFRATWGIVVLFEDSVGAAFARWMPDRARKLDELSVIASLPLSARRVFSVSFALALVGLVAGAGLACALYFTVLRAWWGVAVGVAVALFFIFWFWPSQNLASYAQQRQDRLTKELPFAIDLIGSAMRSGLEFGAAMRYYVSLKTGGPLEAEFGRVLADATLGRPFPDALNDMSQRVKLKVFASFVGVVSYGMEIGAPIADTLKMHGEDLRRERFSIAERKAARAPLIMIVPLVLFIMPAVFIVLLTPLVSRLIGAF